jgi:ribonuclease HI
MGELTQPEVVLLDNVWNQDIQAVIKDIVKCNLTRLKDEFTPAHSKLMEEVLSLHLPPPKEPWAQRQQAHYKKEAVWSKMCEFMEDHPVLRSNNIDRIIAKFQYANNLARHQNQPPN